MKWIPSTHNIEFELKEISQNNFKCVSFVNEEYTGNPQEVYEDVLSEHILINQQAE